MRDIKFRAWDKKRKMIISWRQLFYEETSPGEYLHRALIDSDYILMQYTGLKDKNGKEIFEGDILRDVNNPEWKYEILWGLYEWRMSLHGKKQTTMFRHDQKGHYEYEVIGNIYENPELFKSTD